MNKITGLRYLTNKSKFFFDLHEYQAKHVMKQFKINVQKSNIAQTPLEAFQIAKDLANQNIWVKAQVHAGGRGKGQLTSGLKGGVQLCHSPEEVKSITEKMIGFNLITKQTPKEGLTVNCILVEEGVQLKKEYYLAFLLDRKTQKPIIVYSKFGGMDIEEGSYLQIPVPKKDIHICQIDPQNGLTENDCDQIIGNLNLAHLKSEAHEQLKNLYKLFTELDCLQLEINPWAETSTNHLFCIDGKINIDQNASFRQKALVKLKESSLGSQKVDEHEKKAVEAGLNYVALDGDIGCLVNGAGLAMATMDIIQSYGGQPANFLDVGGGSSVDQIDTAFKILNEHPKVKVILVNIFGGIMQCNKLAEGIIHAAERIQMQKTLICRLSGTNSELGKKIFEEYSKSHKGFKIINADCLEDAAQLAVEHLKKN